MAKGNYRKSFNGFGLDFKARIWAAVGMMHGHMDASEYKHVCLGLIFLKYEMGAIERESGVAQASSPAGSGSVPAASRNTGRGRPANPQPGTAALHSKDVLGRVYDYFPGKFASEEGTLQSANTSCSNRRMHRAFSLSASNDVLRSRERAKVATGRMRVVGGRQIFVARAGVRCRNPRNADSFRVDLHPDLKAGFVPVWKDLANPPFNMSDWGGEDLRQDVRWKFGRPPVNNANYAWGQHFFCTEFNSLTTLCDMLLPKLLSGELAVNELNPAVP